MNEIEALNQQNRELREWLSYLYTVSYGTIEQKLALPQFTQDELKKRLQRALGANF